MVDEDDIMLDDDMPLPPWAVGRAKGEPVVGAQLPTRDGRICGNGHVIEHATSSLMPGVQLYVVLTDAGSRLTMTREEIDWAFHPPVWVSDVREVLRKFGR